MNKNKKLEYKDYWFNYVINEDPNKIKSEIKEDYIISQGLKIHIDIYDDGKEYDKTIIFIHGTTVYSRFYAEFCYTLFKKGYRIIAPDLIGHGMSEGKRGHFTMKEFTQTIYDVTSYVIEKHGANVFVIGSSLGGITALYSAANDNRLKGAICHNAAIFNENAYKKIINIKGILNYLKGAVPFLAKILPTFRLSTLLYLDFYKLAKGEEYIKRIDLVLKDEILALKYTLKSLRTQMREPMKRPVEKIETPVMIINGDEDVLFSVDYMKEIYQRLTCKNKNLVILENTSHLIFQENIEAALENILPWINELNK
ncbi:MAG: alpha/beta fold hydrolase [Promethearchaeota archaeon]